MNLYEQMMRESRKISRINVNKKDKDKVLNYGKLKPFGKSDNFEYAGANPIILDNGDQVEPLIYKGEPSGAVVIVSGNQYDEYEGGDIVVTVADEVSSDPNSPFSWGFYTTDSLDDALNVANKIVEYVDLSPYDYLKAIYKDKRVPELTLEGDDFDSRYYEESNKSRKKKMKEAKSSDSDYKVYSVVMDIAVPAGEEKPSYSQGYGNQKFLSAINRALDDLGYVLAGDMIEADDVTDIYRDDVGFDEIWNEIHNESLKESDLSRDLDDFQSWVDYDMKHYGKISKQTRREVEEAGLKIVKDKFGDYEVIV